jgi:hypothetical protein
MDLTPEQCKSRYSLAFMNALCAQAGLSIGETRQDEDVHAIDMGVIFPEAEVRVQLKCSSKKTMARDFETIALDKGWIAKWSLSLVPVFLVLVVVPDDQREWLEDSDRATLHNTHAYWTRIETPIPDDRKSVRISKADRVTIETLRVWRNALRVGFGKEAV